MSNDTGQRLLEAAIAAFAEKGFHGTTMRDIATAAGVTPGAVYVHHRSKEELLYRISRLGYEGTIDLVRTTVSAADDVVDELRSVMYEFAKWQAVHHTRARIVNYELAALSGEHLSDVLERRQQIQQEIRAILDRGRERGVFDVEDTGMTVVLLISMCIDIARWFRSDGRWTPDDIGASVSRAAMRLVGVVDEPAPAGNR